MKVGLEFISINKFISTIIRKKLTTAMKFNVGPPESLPPVSLSTTNKSRLLYIHVPFCEKLCSYCSFHRVLLNKDLAHDYFNALRCEMRLYKKMGYDFNGIYIGGGTPTIMIDELAETINTAKKYFKINDISVETNPGHLTREKISILKNIGIKRLSVGVQTFDRSLLIATNRYDPYCTEKEIISRLKKLAGEFNTLNVDMMFNFPAQTA
ncbi:MAG: radical SAM protein, partial [Oligoflexia bacterium]|nr:radical SAM protein [Oligoflexia bacterium]